MLRKLLLLVTFAGLLGGVTLLILDGWDSDAAWLLIASATLLQCGWDLLDWRRDRATRRR